MSGPARPTLAVALAVAAMFVAAPLAAEALRPTVRTADVKGAIALDTQVPLAFGGWREDKSVTPVLPDPSLQATLDATYSQVLARTYVNADGQRVMLSIAYGNDQNSEATAVHRPEFCYAAQGFKVAKLDTPLLGFGDHQLRVQRLVGTMGSRLEPITYWITLDESATLFGFDRKLQQLRYGLRGQIADGMVVRVSTVGVPQVQAFELQDRFLGELHDALPGRLKARYFGS
jgi:EpsI family protein